MSNRKYYWIKYIIITEYGSSIRHSTIQQCVSDEHPFNWLSNLKKISSHERKLDDWKEISEEEYDKGKSVIGIG